MSERSDSGQSPGGLKGTAYPPAGASHGPETVINPERRGVALVVDGLRAAVGGSELFRQLFPVESGGEPLATDSAAGVELDHFVIEERIGTGGMGAVFRAVDQRLDRIVALKVLSPGQSHDVSAIQRFRNEARAAARLDHDNIAGVYYFGEDKGLQFIAFEFVTGTNIRDLIQRHGRLEPVEAVNYTLQIATALVHTAAAGVVHRDIKPSNIIVAPNGRAKLVDLGLARKQSEDSSADLTVAGTTLGTFDYISPEQAKDPRHVDVRSDIYSLGCTLYHMLTGEPPYPEGTVLQKLLDHQGKEPPDPRRKNPRVSEQLAGIVRKMMASDRRHRYPDPESLIRDLMLVAGGMGLRALPAEGLVWSRPRAERGSFWERHLGWMATAAALLLIVVLLDQYQFPRLGMRPGPETERRVAQGGNGGPSNSRGDDPHPSSPAAEPLAPGVVATEAVATAAIDAAQQVLIGGSDAPNGGGRFHETATSDGAGAPPSGTIPGPATAGHSTSSGAESPGATPSAPSPGGTSATSFPGDAPSVREAEPPKPPMPGITIVNADGSTLLNDLGEPKGFPTLEGACAAAADYSRIELRFDGRRIGGDGRPVIDEPLRIVKKTLTIKGVDGYRPLLHFRHQSVQAQGDVIQMMTLDSGSLDLIDVDLVMSVDREVPVYDEHWAMFSLQGEDQVRLQGVTISIANDGNRPAAVFELVSGLGGGLDGMKTMRTGFDQRRLDLRIDGSFIRGGCSLIVAKHTEPGRIELHQSGLALEGAVLELLGGRDRPPEGTELELRLEHVTAIVGGGLLRVDSGSIPRELPPVRLAPRDSIFATNTTVPLISMTGANPIEDFRRLLRWDFDKNFYDQFLIAWSIAPTLEMGMEYDFDEWRRIARPSSESPPQAGTILWEGNWLGKEFLDVVPADLRLDLAAFDNPPVAKASDGTDGGVAARTLPIPPAMPAASAVAP
ncbi:MAG: protein kinase [Planctomycetaceae bacterium]